MGEGFKEQDYIGVIMDEGNIHGHRNQAFKATVKKRQRFGFKKRLRRRPKNAA